MSVDSRLEDLLDEWEARREQGEPATPEELCADCPELLPQLQQQIQLLSEMDRRLDAVTGASTADRTPSGAPGDVLGASGEQLAYSSELGELSFHAKGGLGTVYVAQDRKLHREVALKFIHRRLAADPEARARFLIEAEVTGRLEHPGVIPVHGWGQNDDGRLFYAMRFIRGETLETAIQRYQQGDGQAAGMPLHNLLTCFVSICKTIAYAHNCGIIHRDIKPDNVMLGRYGETLVVDWGLAMPVGRDERARSSGERTIMPSGGSQSGSASGTGAGTIQYMSPEQHTEAETIGPESDVYSLGVTLYKILCGQHPFPKQHPHEVKQNVIRGTYRLPREVKPNVPRALQAICLKAMSLDPKERYATALDLAEDVEHFLADEPVTAFREPVSYKLTRWARRHRMGAIVLLGGLVALALVAAGAAVSMGTMANRERDAKVAAQHAQEQSLRTAARFAAKTLASEIDLRWRILETEASSPALRELLEGINQNPSDPGLRESCQAWLDKRKIAHAHTTKAAGWWINDAIGTQVARSPIVDPDYRGQRFAYRDYFHGRGYDLPAGTGAEIAPLRTVHRSVVFRGKSQNDLMVAFSAPVWSDELGAAGRDVIGVLVMVVHLNEFASLRIDEDNKLVAVLVELESDAVEGEARRGLILHHPRLSMGESDAAAAVPRMPAKWLQPMNDRRQLVLNQPDSYQGDNLIHDFPDPAVGGRWLAAYEPVVVEGREAQELKDIGWAVLVQQPEEGAPDESAH